MNAIKAVLDSWQQAVVDENLDRIMSHYSDDIVSFDAVKALHIVGKADYTDHWKYCMELCGGGIIMEIHQLAIHTSGDLALCHYLSRCGSVQDFGKENIGWMRATVCMRHQNGEWKIAHEHYSSPFDPESGKAIFDAQP
ncbi:YybH family protein [Limnobacter alexandrii]|jgi:ketosteroid isomerase-like protein|uniref:YybH family protein n=1 Tax=Limnobacter alexandrii TaxID=2570352 RepID=UPI001109FB76|nr:nuclear transport factor 2 family protein [Limnobacter alexandrii]